MTAGEDALFDPGVHARRAVAADGMDQAAAGGRERALDNIRQRAVVARPHVLEHADRNERVVFAGDVAIVVLDVLHAIRQSLLFRFLARVQNLLV